MTKVDVPTFDTLMNPLIKALKELGGSGSIEEIDSKVIEVADISDQEADVLHSPEKGGRQTEVEYRLAWARTYLKKYGIIENSSRGVWALTPKGREIDRINPKTVVQFFRDQLRNTKAVAEMEEPLDLTKEGTWRDELLEVLLDITPAAFERLIQRVLRESGFFQVEVTGRTGDGGIDGKGIMRLAGLISFRVVFQAKRYSGSVSVSQVRDFRGAMVGRADKALLITTGSFTKEAMREAIRDGAPAIDLIDGDRLVEKLKELGLGVSTQEVRVEEVKVDRNWFESL